MFTRAGRINGSAPGHILTMGPRVMVFAPAPGYVDAVRELTTRVRLRRFAGTGGRA